MLIAPLNNFRTMLSESNAFQLFADVNGSTEALARIHRNILPAPANGNEYTLAEMNALRPLAIIYVSPNNGARAVCDGEQGCWNIGGRIDMMLEWAVPAGDTDSETTFTTAVDAILADLRVQNTFTLNTIEVIGIYRTLPNDLPRIGDAWIARLRFGWGRV